jgi:hypothetical protein
MIELILPLLVVLASLLALTMPLVLCYLNRSEEAAEVVESDVLTTSDRHMINIIDDMDDRELIYLLEVMTMLYEVDRRLKLPHDLEEIAVRRV